MKPPRLRPNVGNCRLLLACSCCLPYDRLGMVKAASESYGTADVEYFQQLADGAPVMIWMSGFDMGCFYFNRAWLDYRGRTTEQEFGNGWAEGVHPEDLERCVHHYVSSFERQEPFAMSYRLQHHSGEFRWILDRGAPHFTADGEFLGFYGGCAETPAEKAVDRIGHLREALHQMREFADRLAAAEAEAQRHYLSTETQSFGAKDRPLHSQHRAREKRGHTHWDACDRHA